MSVQADAARWANQRKAFGKPLNSQPVIRAKLAQMVARIESAQNWLENVTYQMNNMSYNQQSDKLAGYVKGLGFDVSLNTDHAYRQIAFLKMYSTHTSQETAADAVQVFGGRGITRSGMGKFIEHVSSMFPIPR